MPLVETPSKEIPDKRFLFPPFQDMASEKEDNRDRKHIANDPDQEGLPKRNSGRDSVGNSSTKLHQWNHGDQKSNNVVHVLSFQFILFILPYLHWNDNYFKQENLFLGHRKNQTGDIGGLVSFILNDGHHHDLLDPFLVSERALVSLQSYFMLIRICSTKYSSFSTNYIFFACSLVKGSTFGIVKM